MRINLNDLYIRQHIKKPKLVPISQHPYYRALHENNKHIFEEYIHKSSYQSSKDSGSWHGFKELHDTIQRDGFDFVSYHPLVVKQVNNEFICVGGKHRMCMLYHIHGPNTSIDVVNNKVVGIVSEPSFINKLINYFIYI